MLLTLGSIILAALLLAGTAMTTHRIRIGWLYLCAMQLPAGAYDIATHQYGFVAITFVGGWLYWRGWQLRRAWSTDCLPTTAQAEPTNGANNAPASSPPPATAAAGNPTTTAHAAPTCTTNSDSNCTTSSR